MKKIEKKGKQKADSTDGNSPNEGVAVGKVAKDENDKPLNYIKDEIQSEYLLGRCVGVEVQLLWPWSSVTFTTTVVHME